MPAYYRDADGRLQVNANWESLAERRIREAANEGAFDELRGRGRPQDLTENPFEGDLALGHHVLRNAGFRPDWIERQRELDAALTALAARLDAAVDTLASVRARALGDPARVRERHAALRDDYLAAVRAVNSRLDSYNLSVPLPSLARPRLRLEEEAARFDARAPAPPVLP